MSQPDFAYRTPACTALSHHPLTTAVLLGLASLPTARAATIVVTSSADGSVTAATCTLRQAVLSMNNSTVSGNCVNTGAAFGSNDTINFAAGVSTITLADAPNNELHITANQLSIDAGAGRTVTIEGPTLASNNDFSLIWSQGQSLSLTGLALKNGVANHRFNTEDKYGTTFAAGGAIYASSNLTLNRCSIVGSEAEVGGAIFTNGRTSTLTIQNTELSSNKAAVGGALTMWRGALTMLDSTVSGNQGSGIALYSASAYLRNATITGNKAGMFGLPGKYNGANASAIIVDNLSRRPLTIVSSTIACNDGAPTAIMPWAADPTLINTVLANTTNQACTTTTTSDIALPAAVANPVPVHGDHNLVSSIGTNIVFDTPPLNGDPRLLPLASNGGLTRTHALAASSPIIDRGANPTNIAYDQRGSGFARESGAAADIGAFEIQNPTYCGAANRQPFSNLTSASPNLCGAGTTLLSFTENSGSANWWSWICGLPPDFNSLSGCFAVIRTTTGMTVTDAGNNPVTTAIYGQPLRLKPTVLSAYTGSGSPPAPTGTVSFFDATGATLEPICTNIPISAFCTTPAGAPVAGARKLQAFYSGDTKYGRSSSALAPITIQPATATTTIVSQTPNPAALGSSFSVVVQVQANAPSLVTPSGLVEVTDQTDNVSCSYNLAAATPGCAITPTSAGTHALRVRYLGDNGGNIGMSQATGTQTVTAPAIGLTVTDDLAFARYGQTLQYTVTLSNTGNGSATDVALSGTPSANFAGATVQWQCIPTAGASCAASGSGTALSDTATLPANSSATWTASITVPPNASGAAVQFDVSATGHATVGDTDTLVIFRTGFD